MKPLVAKTLTVALTVLLILLLSTAIVLRGQSDGQAPEAGAERAVAEKLEALRREVQALPESDSLDAGARKKLVRALDEQLSALDAQPQGTASSSSGSPVAGPRDAGALMDHYTEAAKDVGAEARSRHADARTSALYSSIAANLWATPVLLEDRGEEITDPASPARTALDDVLGTGHGAAPELSGLCPAGQQGEGSDQDARSSAALPALEDGLNRAVWSEQTWAAREDLSGNQGGKDAAAVLERSARIHTSEQTRLREGLRGCGPVRAPHAGYRLPDEPVRSALGAQSDQLSGSWQALMAEHPVNGAHRERTAWGRFAARSLALETALAAETSGTVPALPGR